MIHRAEVSQRFIDHRGATVIGGDGGGDNLAVGINPGIVLRRYRNSAPCLHGFLVGSGILHIRLRPAADQIAGKNASDTHSGGSVKRRRHRFRRVADRGIDQGFIHRRDQQIPSRIHRGIQKVCLHLRRLLILKRT